MNNSFKAKVKIENVELWNDIADNTLTVSNEIKFEYANFMIRNQFWLLLNIKILQSDNSFTLIQGNFFTPTNEIPYFKKDKPYNMVYNDDSRYFGEIVFVEVW